MSSKKHSVISSDNTQPNEASDTAKATNHTSSRKRKIIAITVFAVLAVLLAAFVAFYLSGTFGKDNNTESDTVTDTEAEEFIPSAETPKDAAEAYIHAIAVERSVDALTACVHDDIISAYIEENYDGSYDDFSNMLSTSFALLSDVNTTYSLSESRDLSADEIEEVGKYYEEPDNYTFAAVDAHLKLNGTMSDVAVDESDSTTYITVLIDGKWYVDLRLVR